MTRDAERERRLAEALRDNLRKRKAQQRAVPPERSVDQPPPQED